MEFLLYISIFLLLVIIALIVKIYLLRKSAKEIETSLSDKISVETNTLIDISSNDKHMKNLANNINNELRNLRKERQRYQQGDEEIKNTIISISHDLRTPLTAIYGYLSLLEDVEKSEEIENYLNIIKNRAELLKSLTDELFQYSRVVTSDYDLHKEPISINSVLEESIAGFYTVLSKSNIIPNIQMPEKAVIKNLNKVALFRIFSNLLDNVIKYSDGDLDIKLLETGDLFFSNKASELNEIEVGKIFNRFYTVKSGQKSTGMGLAIAKNLVEQMNGVIVAEYHNGKLKICISFKDM